MKPENRVLHGKKIEKYRWPFKIENPRSVVVTDLVHCTTNFPLKIKIIFYFTFILAGIFPLRVKISYKGVRVKFHVKVKQHLKTRRHEKKKILFTKHFNTCTPETTLHSYLILKELGTRRIGMY